MKRIFFIVLLLVAFLNGNAQYTPNATWIEYKGRVKFTGTAQFPNHFPDVSDSGLVVFKNGRLWVKVNNTDWAGILKEGEGSGVPVDTIPLSTRLNQKLNIADTTNRWVRNISRNADSIIFFIGNTRYAIKDSVGGGGTADVTTIRDSLQSIYDSVDAIKNPAIYGDFINDRFLGTTLDASKWGGGSGFYTVNNGITISGTGTGYWDKYLITDTSTASLNYRVIGEFVLNAIPATPGEGPYVWKGSANVNGRSSTIVKMVRLSPTTWTPELIFLAGFSTLVDSVKAPFGQALQMNVGDTYRVELFFQNPQIVVKATRLTNGYEQESVTVPYRHKLIIGTDAQVANTGGYGLGTLGGTYKFNQLRTIHYDQKEVDVVVLGNSLSVGYSAIDAKHGWVQQLFEESGLKYNVFGGPGDRTTEALLRPYDATKTLKKGGLVLLEFWHNDVGSLSASQYQTNLDSLVRLYKTAGFNVAVTKWGTSGFASFDTVPAYVGRKNNIPCIDLYPNAIGYFADGFNIHENQYGMGIEAAHIRAQLQEFFRAPTNRAWQPYIGLQKSITNNITVDHVYQDYQVNASGGNIVLGDGTVKTSVIGFKYSVTKTDATSNSVTVQMFGGAATINGTTTIAINKQWQRIDLTCTGINSWAATIAQKDTATGGGGGGGSYTFSTGLTNTTGTVTNDLATGKAGGGTINGGTASGEELLINSTSHATGGEINLNKFKGGKVGISMAANTLKGVLNIKGNYNFGSNLPSNSTLYSAGYNHFVNGDRSVNISFETSPFPFASVAGYDYGTSAAMPLILNVNGNNIAAGFGGTTAPASKLAVYGNFSVGSTYFTTAAPTNGAIIEGNVGIGKNSASEKLDISGNVRFSGALMPNNAAGSSGQVLTSAGAGSPPTWTSLNTSGGEYTPTLTLTSNINEATPYLTQYARNGDRITVFGRVDIEPMATGAVELRMTLPVATAFTVDYEAGGSATCAETGESIGVLSVSATGVVAFKYLATTTSNNSFRFQFSYKVIN